MTTLRIGKLALADTGTSYPGSSWSECIVPEAWRSTPTPDGLFYPATNLILIPRSVEQTLRAIIPADWFDDRHGFSSFRITGHRLGQIEWARDRYLEQPERSELVALLLNRIAWWTRHALQAYKRAAFVEITYWDDED